MSKNGRLPTQSSAWRADSYLVDTCIQPATTSLHRLAAATTLDSIGASELDPKLRGPYPVHVAALVEPMPVAELRCAYQMLKGV